MGRAGKSLALPHILVITKPGNYSYQKEDGIMEEFAYSIYTDDMENFLEVEFEVADTFEEAERKFCDQVEKYRDDPSTVTYLYDPLNGNMIMESDWTPAQ